MQTAVLKADQWECPLAAQMVGQKASPKAALWADLKAGSMAVLWAAQKAEMKAVHWVAKREHPSAGLLVEPSAVNSEQKMAGH